MVGAISNNVQAYPSPDSRGKKSTVVLIKRLRNFTVYMFAFGSVRKV